jgi:hypothetical protein
VRHRPCRRSVDAIGQIFESAGGGKYLKLSDVPCRRKSGWRRVLLLVLMLMATDSNAMSVENQVIDTIEACIRHRLIRIYRTFNRHRAARVANGKDGRAMREIIEM